jgi:hypothetical protein
MNKHNTKYLIYKKMVKIKSKINIDDFLTLIYWVKTMYFMEGKEFAYESLYQQAQTYKYNDTPLDVNIHKIDDFLIDAYWIYDKLRKTQDKMLDIVDAIPTVNKDDIVKETQKYENIFESIMENFKFDEPEIRGIQKGILNERMKEYVEVEDYENAAKVRDMIKIC